MTRPFMQPVKRVSISILQSSLDIQLPSWLHFRFFKLHEGSAEVKPCIGVGTVSIWLVVDINVLDSTRATSRGSVSANQLEINKTFVFRSHNLNNQIVRKTYQFFILSSFWIRPDFSRRCRRAWFSFSVPSQMYKWPGWHNCTFSST